METINLTANKRAVKGKGTKKLRQQGKLPAVLYGHKVDTADLEVNEKDFSKVFKAAGESTLVNLSVGGKSQPVLIQEVQHHYLNGKPIHVDFFAVNMSEKLKAKVPLHFVGESAAIKNLGGTLIKNISEVEVECLPADLPHSIEVDISGLNTFEDAIHIKDLKISDKVQIHAQPDEMVTTVAAPRTEEELASLSEKPVVEDVTKVEGVVKPEAPAPAPEEPQEKPE